MDVIQRLFDIAYRLALVVQLKDLVAAAFQPHMQIGYPRLP